MLFSATHEVSGYRPPVTTNFAYGINKVTPEPAQPLLTWIC